MKSILKYIVLVTLIFGSSQMALGQNVEIDPVKKTDLNIFPNPVQDIFQLNHPDNVKYISIYNIPGREIKRFEVRGNNTFNINDLSKGIYIIRLFDHKNEPLKVMRLNKA